jgi:hypothetical protein
MQHERASQKTRVTWRLPSQPIGALAAAYRKHTSHKSYPLLWWCHWTCADVCLLSCCIGTGCIKTFFHCCVLDPIYGAVAWQCVDQIRYNIITSCSKKLVNSCYKIFVCVCTWMKERMDCRADLHVLPHNYRFQKLNCAPWEFWARLYYCHILWACLEIYLVYLFTVYLAMLSLVEVKVR